MIDLQKIFEVLVHAASQGQFESALMKTPLAAERLHGHPLGFKVVRLSKEDVQLRLHMWSGPPTEQPGMEIHDHSFDLVCCVVQGAIRQTLFELHEDPEGTQSVYRVSYSHGQSLLEKTKEIVRVEKLSRDVMAAGTQYEIKAGKLHATERHECETAITLVLTHDKGGLPLTIGPRDGPKYLFASRAPLSDASLKDLGLEAAFHV